MRFLLLSIIFLFISCKNEVTPSKELVLTEGISLELATYRKQQVENVSYHLEFNIPRERSEPIASKLQLNATVLDLTHDLFLDFNEDKSKLKAVSVNNTKIEIVHEKEHVIIPIESLEKGENLIEITFDAGELSLNRNDEFLYTLLVPDRASTLFPCFDQPDIKATYKLVITAPKDWKVVCGGFEEGQTNQGDFIKHIFKETDRMSTYLFSFVAGKFEEEIKNPGAFDMRFLYRETDTAKIAQSLDVVFNTHQESIDFLEEYTNYEFPFQKLDFVGIPPFQYGGMEHVGAIQYRESSLFLDKNATQTRKLGRAKLIGHETAHMWFGDLVTMRWFNDVWMKEVFANFMADKIINPIFPEINHNLQFMMTHYPSAYSEDRTKGTNPIRQELANLKNAGSLYGRIIYNKAPIMMRQLEAVLGKEKFKKGIQEYIKKYADDNADWTELVAILDQKSDRDINTWSEVWVNSSGRPVFTDSVVYADGKIASFNLTQHAEDGSDKIWPQTFSVGLVYTDSVKVIDVDFSSETLQLEESIGLLEPNQIIYNYNGFGYGIFPVKESEIDGYRNLKNDVARGYAFINLYENVLSGNIKAKKAFLILREALIVEENELISNYVSNTMRTIFFKFLTQQTQNNIHTETENSVFELLKKDVTPGMKRTYFNLYRELAFSDRGKENLYNIWNGTLKIPNLTLNENDKIRLAIQLAIFEHQKASEIISTQTKQIKNEDRLARFKWLLPSISNDESKRDTFMKSLADAENREKESWVQAALNNIHHPLREKSGIKNLKMCLELLEEIQLTGDIFFPKRWLQSSLGNYSSQEAHQIVVEFLDEHKNMNPVLKNKLLQVADNLERAQSIKN